MKNVITVLTTARPNDVRYLRGTVAFLDAAGARLAYDRWVVSDGPMVNADGMWAGQRGWKIAATEEKQGARAGLWRCIYLACALGADRLVHFEDDVLPCANAVQYMLEVPVPEEVGMLTFCDTREVEQGQPHGIYVRPAAGTRRKGFWTAAALVIPGRAVRDLARRDFEAYYHDNPQASDLALGDALEATPRPYYGVHVPSLVQHIGDFSNFAGSPVRRANNFVGVECDALSFVGDRLHESLFGAVEWKKNG